MFLNSLSVVLLGTNSPLLLPALEGCCTCGGPPDNSGACNSGLDDGNVGSQFGFEDRVEVVGPSCCDQAVAVREFGEDSDIVGIFVLHSICHLYSFINQQCSRQQL